MWLELRPSGQQLPRKTSEDDNRELTGVNDHLPPRGKEFRESHVSGSPISINAKEASPSLHAAA